MAFIPALIFATQRRTVASSAAEVFRQKSLKFR
jgi:hypothetical protein